MDFRLELEVKPFRQKINIRDRIMLIGSCFTDHMASRFRQHKFQVLENPNGIVFNPVSIANAVESYLTKKEYTADDLFFFNDLWTSWQHHSDFSNPSQAQTLSVINQSILKANSFIKNANLLIITLGSSFVYELKSDSLNGSIGEVAANCHKVPAQHFTHRLPAYAEVEAAVLKIIALAKQANPSLQIVFTISPVRHYREGLIENNRSKALLHTAVHTAIQQHEEVQYFPAYELIIDDLRDYRFYAEDMVHPNHQATQYVWEKLVAAAIDDESQAIMKQLLSIHHARNHRPMHSETKQHQQFLATMHKRTKTLMEQYPFLHLEDELAYFGNEHKAH